MKYIHEIDYYVGKLSYACEHWRVFMATNALFLVKFADKMKVYSLKIETPIEADETNVEGNRHLS